MPRGLGSEDHRAHRYSTRKGWRKVIPEVAHFAQDPKEEVAPKVSR